MSVINATLTVYLEKRFQRSDYEWEVRIEGKRSLCDAAEGKRSLCGVTKDRRDGLRAVERAMAELLGL